MKRSLPAALAVPAVATLALFAGGCGTSTTAGAGSDGKVAVTAAFYTLQHAAEQVGGPHVTVTALTPPGAEPHDVELTPKAVAGLGSAQLVTYLKGFQPAVDQAVATVGRTAAYDVTADARLTLTASDDGHNHAATAPDPHFWLDPTRYAAVVTALGERLAGIDPGHADDYRANAKRYAAQLASLDADFTAGLAHCTSHELVTGHAAFAYLADRYGLHQESIAGLSPDTEPTPAQLASVTAFVKEHRVSTVYSETLVSPALTETLARETGAKVAVLDPGEGITAASAATDYVGVMRANLATLRTGQQCQ